MNNNTTLKRIAEILDLSISTVSRALKNHPDIAEKTKQKVKELADALDYEPNMHAIKLRSGNSHILAVMVPHVSGYFYDSFISAIEEECRKNNYALMILQSGDDPANEADNIRLCKHNRVSGLFACITPTTSDTGIFERLTDAGIPLIFFDKVPPAANIYTVCLADAPAAQMAAAYLLQKKKKNILAIFGNAQLSITQKRRAAFNDMIGNDTSAKTTEVFADNFIAAYKTALAYLTGAGIPDTVFCMSDEILTGVMKAVQQLRLSIPAEITVIALSNGSVPALYYPEITYVETSGYKLGKLAFIQMIALINGGNPVKNSIVETTLVEGGSF